MEVEIEMATEAEMGDRDGERDGYNDTHDT